MTVYVTCYLFLKNMLLNVHKHKVNCFHRSVNLITMIDSYRNVTEHIFQWNYITPFRVKTINIVYPYHTIKSISLCEQIFLVPFQYLCGYWYFAERNGTALKIWNAYLLMGKIYLHSPSLCRVHVLSGSVSFRKVPGNTNTDIVILRNGTRKTCAQTEKCS